MVTGLKMSGGEALGCWYWALQGVISVCMETTWQNEGMIPANATKGHLIPTRANSIPEALIPVLEPVLR